MTPAIVTVPALVASRAGLRASRLSDDAALTVEQVIRENIAAEGALEMRESVRSLRITGKLIVAPGAEGTVSLEYKRPSMVRQEVTFAGLTEIRAYDGETGWSVDPSSGQTQPQRLSPDSLNDLQYMADIDGPLVNYKAKGHTVELIGKEKVKGSDAYQLKVVLKHGDVVYVYIDAHSFLTIKATYQSRSGNDDQVENTFANYKEVGGIQWPHAVQVLTKGQPTINIQIEKIELNPLLDDAHFKMPVSAHAATPPDSFDRFLGPPASESARSERAS
jgi:hypothetical protein